MNFGKSISNGFSNYVTFSVRRLHDVNRSGWWLLITFTGLGILLLLFWAVQPSNQQESKY